MGFFDNVKSTYPSNYTPMTFTTFAKHASTIAQPLRLYPYDLYTRQYVRSNKRAIDTIVPIDVLHTKGVYLGDDAWKNMFVVHTNMKEFRAGYRFGGSVEDILGNPTEWETMRHVVFRNHRHELFFPIYGQQIIARTWTMMRLKYPALKSVEESIFDMDIHETWSKKPCEQFDRDFMELREKNIYNDGHV